VTGLSGGNITSVLADGQGDKIELSLSLQISSSGQTAGQISFGTISTTGSN
jgi:hypothetical protein